MVDAQAVDQPLSHQLENFRVGRLEYRWTLDPQSTQFVDIEKAPPVDVIGGGAPTGEAIALAFEQVVQSLEAFAGLRVVGFQIVLDALQNRGMAGQFAQLVFQRNRQAVGVSLIAQGAETIDQ
ncbi:hypothetical protein D3C84_811850 [compost metagenome]